MSSETVIPEDVVYHNTLKLLSDDPDGSMERLMQDIVKWQKENPVSEDYDGFEWYQVHGDARTLNKLVTRRVLEVRFKSNKSTLYAAVNLDGIQRALSDYRGMATPLMEQETEIPPNLFDIIVGHKDKKNILWRSINSEKAIHCLLYGAVASAKSLMLEELNRLPRSRFVLGSSLSKAGLFDLMFTEEPRYLIIDELDKIDDEDNLSALLSLTQTGFLSETKYHRHRKRYFTTWVFASANRIKKIRPELLSRFCKLHFKEYTRDEFLEVTLRVLVDREEVASIIAPYIAKKTMYDLHSRDVRDAVRVARLLKTPSKKDVDKVINILQKQL